MYTNVYKYLNVYPCFYNMNIIIMNVLLYLVKCSLMLFVNGEIMDYFLICTLCLLHRVYQNGYYLLKIELSVQWMISGKCVMRQALWHLLFSQQCPGTVLVTGLGCGPCVGSPGREASRMAVGWVASGPRLALPCSGPCSQASGTDLTNDSTIILAILIETT